MLAFRLELAWPRKEGHRIAVVDLDEDYVPVGTPLVIEPAMVSRRATSAGMRLYKFQSGLVTGSSGLS